MVSLIKNSKVEPVVVIGTGIAGLLLSIELAESGLSTILITKSRIEQSNTAWAQGGLAAVTGQNALDCFDQHLLDTIMAGDGMTDHLIARAIVNEGGTLVNRLASLGVEFDLSSLALEGGHSLSRVVHSADATGRFIIEALTERAVNHRLISVLENCFLKEVLVDRGRACGVLVERCDAGSTESVSKRIYAKAVVLATGGLGRIFSRTTNPPTATGDGIATAFRAGACLADMEFVQFHPTALHLEGAPAFLVSEAVRGAGAVLLDGKGNRFIHKYSAKGELSTRDIVSRAIFWNMLEEGSECVWLDMTEIGSHTILERFPNIVTRVRSFGIDPLKDPIPVSPAAHYFMGGILADQLGRTSLPGLFAIGECACTGLHGANRLASNSLLEGGVMALKLARFLAGKESPKNHLSELSENARSKKGRVQNIWAGVAPFQDLTIENAKFESLTTNGAPYPMVDDELLRADLFTYAGLVRTDAGLNEFLKKCYWMNGNNCEHATGRSLETSAGSSLGTSAGISPRTGVAAEQQNAFLLGKLIARSALMRLESRGAHFREDYPQKNDAAFRSRLIHHKDGLFWLPISTQTGEAVATAPLSVSTLQVS